MVGWQWRRSQLRQGSGNKWCLLCVPSGIQPSRSKAHCPRCQGQKWSQAPQWQNPQNRVVNRLLGHLFRSIHRVGDVAFHLAHTWNISTVAMSHLWNHLNNIPIHGHQPPLSSHSNQDTRSPETWGQSYDKYKIGTSLTFTLGKDSSPYSHIIQMHSNYQADCLDKRMTRLLFTSRKIHWGYAVKKKLISRQLWPWEGNTRLRISRFNSHPWFTA